MIQSEIKDKMHDLSYEKVDSGELVKFVFSGKEDIKDNGKFIIVHEKEFIYEGEFYDIVKKEIKKDSTIYYCVNDKEETKLVENLREYQNKNSEDDKANTNPELKNFLKYYLNNSHYYIASLNDFGTFLRDVQNTYKPIIIETPTPPPKLS
jgi:heat shock protein HspQ